ncbi:FAD-dependent monooxygenase [Actinosynnema pretiosum subsp. pretiosum]|uniref:FAD-dependent monooxygenase n=1 Tax=Actinosynnema pretiosum subsp. pretiosum TaxID=103721 RepID=A0AA45L5S7_9PSEU|nr:monooxygenase, FAD-binding [Actinosynnema pretiosum subsp. pretiosum]QUF03821.1 FAD-dependent monooxygenase [Actinosynnema pretiosum subsp. pretiosum]
MDTQVLIIGAGPTGLALAADLTRRGVGHRIVDRAAGPFTGSRAKGVQPRTLEVLDDLGVVDRVLAAGTTTLPARWVDGDRARVVDLNEGRHPTPNTPYARTLVIPQFATEAALRSLVPHVEYGAEVTGLTQDEHGVTAVVNGREITAAYAVACDGGRSPVRKRLGVGFAGETLEDHRIVVADVVVDGLDRDHWHMWRSDPASMLALCPLPGTDLFQLQANLAPDREGAPAEAELRELVTTRTGRPELVLREVAWTSLFRLNVRMVDRYRVGRVFLAGDAAHVHSPSGAQGMNTGVQDACNLGWKLGSALSGALSTEAAEALLDSYEGERLPIAAWLLGVTTEAHRRMAAEMKIGKRDDELLQLGLGYREGPLAEPSGLDGVQPGDRAPDAPCALADGTRTRVFDLLRGPGFTLLGLGVEPPAHDGVRAHRIEDPDGHVAAGYGLPDGALALVRPDGYVGAVSHDPEVISGYLKRVLG